MNSKLDRWGSQRASEGQACAVWPQEITFYRIFVAHSRAGRDGRHIELLGFYNPIAGKDGNKEVSIKSDRVKYWLSVGAQPTDTVRGLYRAGLMKPPTQP